MSEIQQVNHYLVGSLATNGPGRQGFRRLGETHESLDDAVQAALAHWSDAFGDGQTPTHRVYRADDGRTALVEILDPCVEMTCLGLFKVVGAFGSPGGVPAPVKMPAALAP